MITGELLSTPMHCEFRLVEKTQHTDRMVTYEFYCTHCLRVVKITPAYFDRFGTTHKGEIAQVDLDTLFTCKTSTQDNVQQSPQDGSNLIGDTK
jgi:hypothetical protein